MVGECECQDLPWKKELAAQYIISPKITESEAPSRQQHKKKKVMAERKTGKEVANTRLFFYKTNTTWELGKCSETLCSLEKVFLWGKHKTKRHQVMSAYTKQTWICQTARIWKDLGGLGQLMKSPLVAKAEITMMSPELGFWTTSYDKDAAKPKGA